MEIILKNNLKAMRFNKGMMTQAQLANALDVSRQTIIAIEQGKFNPSVKLALHIAAFFGHRVEAIFYLTKEE
ncbi:MAG: helix-turn-helix transcriptional regulator [Bacteroidales bacterium]|nr:helix-turn-helix transcriptional regulator [Bacteroidales bacterium]